MNIKSNIRELEGALNKLVALSNLENREITVKLAEEALKDIISPDEKKEVTPAFIISTVAEHFHVSVDDIRSNKRNTEIVVPRQIAMYLCSNLTSVGLKKIGSEMGGRDHSTVLHGSKKISSELKTSEDMRKTIEILKKKINPSWKLSTKLSTYPQDIYGICGGMHCGHLFINNRLDFPLFTVDFSDCA